MPVKPFPARETREALLSALPEHDQASPESRPPQFTYVPPSHAHALNPDNAIVEGMRGAGKSHWFAFLNSPVRLQYLETIFPEARIAKDRLEVSQGFGLGLDPRRSPGKDVLAELLGKGYNARHIWQAVIGVHTGFAALQSPSWEDRVAWVRGHAEDFDSLLYDAGEALAREKRTRVILFDALDRLADDWQGVRPLAKALFQLALDTLANKGVRLKLFARPDMLKDKEILAFPDSSKLDAKKVSLTWRRVDLYALLFQCLANDTGHGSIFRGHSSATFQLKWEERANQAWALPDELRRDEDMQKMVFHALTGPTMAAGDSGHKRGFPYTWLPNHLVDGRDEVSPRSFFAALRSAAAIEPPPDWDYALHFKAIFAGVQKASEIRVKEITQEDYPWVEPLMEPLRGLLVPCLPEEVLELWMKDGTLDRAQRRLEKSEVKLLPPHFDEGHSGVLRDLKDLGVIHSLLDGRIQMPDVYRIAFGLGRKGGVKPLK